MTTLPEAFAILAEKRYEGRASLHGHHVAGTPYQYKHGWIPVALGFDPSPKGQPKVNWGKLSAAEENASAQLVSQAGNHRINDPLRHGQHQYRPNGTAFFNDPRGVAEDWQRNGLLSEYDSLTHSGTVSQDGVVYRGIALPKGVKAEEEFRSGTTFQDMGYPSTTENLAFARECAAARSSGINTGFEVDDHFTPTGGDQVIMKVALRKGQKVGPGSQYAKEIILPRGAYFKVTGIGKSQQVSVNPDQPPYTQTMVTVEVEGYD